MLWHVPRTRHGLEARLTKHNHKRLGNDSESADSRRGPRCAVKIGHTARSKLAIQAIHPANVLKTDGAHFLLGVIAQ